ncbi:hypothetical protein HD806DRAFT_122430 [Xylariaceae sp. AK1471]|nr:hypothetical protein HD806DRAFT_122430 [Xylariaceae sp. AK1471]
MVCPFLLRGYPNSEAGRTPSFSRKYCLRVLFRNHSILHSSANVQVNVQAEPGGLRGPIIMPDLQLVRTTWDFLRALHPLFHSAESLPTVEDAGGGCYGSLSADDVDSLKNEITMLRNDFKLNIIKQQLVDINQLAESSRLGELQLELRSLLEELEDLIDPRICNIEEFEPKVDAESLSCFSKLVALRKLLRKHDSPELKDHTYLEDGSDSKDSSDTSILTEANITSLDTESSRDKRYSHTSVARVAASYIRFPRDAVKIGSCRRIVSRFGMVLDKLLGDSVGSWTMETQTLDCTPQDVEVIKYAHSFASTCKSLFDQMMICAECGTPHRAKLHLSGFRRDQLEMSIGTCQETGWISTMFTRSFEKPSLDFMNLSYIYSHSSSPPTGTRMLHIAFNSLRMWEHPPDNKAWSDTTSHFGRDKYKALDKFLIHEHRLNLKHRKLAGVLLASSLFQLSDSPWIERQFAADSVLVPLPDTKQLHQWCPQVVCTLAPKENPGLQSDDIAAFGVLILELEADRKAPWTKEDNDWISGAKSNYVRLARILKDWEGDVSDEYRGVAKACLEFDSLVENFDHPDIMLDQKGLAVIYKCILEPLFCHLIRSFGNLSSLFEGMLGPWRSLAAPMRLSPSNTAKRVLFDDDESLSKPDDRVTAAGFLKNLQKFFDKIRVLHKTTSLAKPSGHEKIRIAVLDSGVDDTDPTIRPAMKFGRINASKSKSFVGRPNEWQDTHGHGTHVARLLLETAPAAEIYVGKICTGKMINDEFMPGIAKAIDWAVKECDAHIISMSFGFEDEDELIDEAVENAVEAGKLVFAAASNNGGISGRARPARHEDVICIHASDGKGNKGGMNPTPMSNKDNFATLGVAVPSKWKGTEVWKSGTSFATPIAAGFAANVLEFANHKCVNLRPGKQKLLRKKRGMQAIFRKMAEERDGYDFIHPVRLWQDKMTEQEVARVIEDIVRGL